MKKTKYTFSHFIMVDGVKKEIDPTKDDMISGQCKLLWANLATGKDHMLMNKVAL
ncbi:hypothetical protein MPH47_06250 [Psychrobacillus psychrodurans]|uniref:hypothetical protein n=1 Tax=Psychrobacillus psychrodurans TaxID=126157 RepID=UPI001F4E3788|nr:hypothetical protein [Psychrobacillus psychrodurans]MCK1996832.1 hypothetical protein [Psychrobacillus psychrodurans]